MANFTLRPGPFPVGTTVGVYDHKTLIQDSGPIGALITSAVTATDQTTTFTGLAFDTRYWAAASVSGTWRKVAFTTERDPLLSGSVSSVAGKTGAVSLVKADVGLGSVDNTSDAAKPVSTAAESRLGLLESIHVIARGTGIDPTGATDSHAAIQAKLNDLHTAGGGTLVFPPGTFRIDGLLTIPNVGGSTWPRMRPLRITGAGYHVSGRDGVSGDPVGGTILDLRYNGASTAKIIALGVGRLEIDHLSLRDEGNTGKPFILTTGATLKIHHVCFAGFGALATTTCNQDAVIFGGTVAGAGDGSENSPFQGYGSTIDHCYFTRIRRVAFFRVYANAINISDNWIGHTCGSNLAGGACIEADGDPTNACTGNVLAGNHFETIGYPYPVRLQRSIGWVLGANGFYDPTATTLAYYRFDSAASYNTLIDGYHDGAKPLKSEDAAVLGLNRITTAHQGVESNLPGTTRIDTLKSRQGTFDGGNGAHLVQPAANVSNEFFPLTQVLRSAAQTLNGAAGAALWEQYNGGVIYIGSNKGSTPGTPTAGGYLYVTAGGALTYKGLSGTVTTIAPA